MPSLNEQIVEFSRRLRAEGVRTSQADTLVAIEALMHIDLLNKNTFYNTLRTIFCFSPEDYRRFERVFRGFWEFSTTPAGQEQIIHDETNQKDEDNSSDHDISSVDGEEHIKTEINHFNSFVEQNNTLFEQDRKESSLSKIGSYSFDERLLSKSFAADPFLKQNKIDDKLSILLYLLKQSLALDKDRSGNKHIHFKKTIRKNIQYGGDDFFKLHRYGRSKKNNQQLITLADISGSMDSYLKKYLVLLYKLHAYARNTEVFLFNTNTYRVTKYFQYEYHQTIELLNEKLRMTSKGTNLAKSIKYIRKNFHYHLSPELTTILIFSDGWDRGDMDDLKKELSWLKKQVYQIIWLNPLLGSKGYTPITQALETAKPYINYLVSENDYKALYFKN